MEAVLIGVRPDTPQWCQRSLKRQPRVELDIDLLVPLSGGRCVEIATLRGPDAAAEARRIGTDPGVAESTLMASGRETAQLRLTVTDCPVAKLVRETALLPRLPFQVATGEDLWVIMGQRAELKDAMERAAELGVHVREIETTTPEQIASMLTAHQRQVLAEAVRAGYYAFPRRTTATALAGTFGVTKSTISETLMLIEKKIVDAHMARSRRPDAPLSG